MRTDRLSEGPSRAITYLKAERGDIEDDDAGAIYVSITPNGRYAFVSEEQAGTLTVIDLLRAEASGRSKALVGEIDVGNAPITTVFSSDGTKLYGTIGRASQRLGDPEHLQNGRALVPTILRGFPLELSFLWTLQLPNEFVGPH